jgi:hypothetical protein
VYIWASRFEANYAKVLSRQTSTKILCHNPTTLFDQTIGGAVLIDIRGAVDLSHSNFLSNEANGNASGIVNLGGEVRCDPAGCRPMCTSCRNDAADTPTSLPTTLPTVPPTVLPTALPTLSTTPIITMPLEDDAVDELPPTRTASRESTFSLMLLDLLGALAALVLLGGVALWRRRRCAASGPAEQQMAGIEMGDGGLPTEPLFFDCMNVSHVDGDERPAAQTQEHEDPSSFLLAPAPLAPLPVDPSLDEAPAQDLNMSFLALRSSPAPIFVVNTAMRIVLWSRGARWHYL